MNMHMLVLFQASKGLKVQHDMTRDESEGENRQRNDGEQGFGMLLGRRGRSINDLPFG